jgi:hypothetical protein
VAVAEQPRPVAVHQPVNQSSEPPVEQSEAELNHEPQPTPEPVNRGGLTLVTRDVNHRGVAEQVVQRSGSDWTVDQIETVIRSTPGRGQRPLAEDLGVSASTVNRMRKVIAEVIAETEIDESVPVA